MFEAGAMKTQNLPLTVRPSMILIIRSRLVGVKNQNAPDSGVTPTATAGRARLCVGLRAVTVTLKRPELPPSRHNVKPSPAQAFTVA